LSKSNRTPAEHSADSRAGAYLSWSLTPDRTARTAAARAASDQRFWNQTDPTLSPAERAKRAEQARHAHYARMTAASLKSRRLAKKARNDR
jgi:hypothetical protein